VAAADAAVVALKDAGVALEDAIGVLVLDENGDVKTHKLGSHSFYNQIAPSRRRGYDRPRPQERAHGRRSKRPGTETTSRGWSGPQRYARTSPPTPVAATKSSNERATGPTLGAAVIQLCSR
jgi:hypothetical protein